MFLPQIWPKSIWSNPSKHHWTIICMHTFDVDPCLDLRDREGRVGSQGMKDIHQDTQDIRDIPYRHHLHCDHWKYFTHLINFTKILNLLPKQLIIRFSTRYGYHLWWRIKKIFDLVYQVHILLSLIILDLGIKNTHLNILFLLVNYLTKLKLFIFQPFLW